MDEKISKEGFKSIIGTARVVQDNKLDDYSKVAIADFGISMLNKMGWDKSKADNNLDKKPYEVKLRQHRLGLGAKPLEDNNNKNNLIKFNNESNIRSIYGTKVKVRKGTYKGLKGVILDNIKSEIKNFLENNKYVQVELSKSGRKVQIESQYIKLRKKNHERNKSKSLSNSRSRSRSKEEKDKVDKNQAQNLNNTKNNSNNNNKKNHKILQWVVPNIFVQITNKKSKYYKTKARIEDIFDIYTFSLITFDNKTHFDFTEDDLETVMPVIGDKVKVLIGKYKGVDAVLMQRNKKENKITVQTLNDLSILDLTQDDCCSNYSNNIN